MNIKEMIDLNAFDILLLGVVVINFLSFTKIISHEKEIRKLNNIIKYLLDRDKINNTDESK